MHRTITFALILTLVACRDARHAERHIGDSTAIGPCCQQPRGYSIDADTGQVTSSGPLLVAAFITTQAEIDSGDGGEALSDFQFYLPSVADSLGTLGVRTAVRYARPIRIVMDRDSIVWRVEEDSGRVGYMMLRPGKPSRTVWGVMTNEDLLSEAKEYFRVERAPGK
jgi:hypothetical protein